MLVEIVEQRVDGVARRALRVVVQDHAVARISLISSRGVKWCWKSTIICVLSGLSIWAAAFER